MFQYLHAIVQYSTYLREIKVTTNRKWHRDGNCTTYDSLAGKAHVKIQEAFQNTDFDMR